MKRRYTVLLELDPDDKVYVASVPALPGCVTQGDTRDEALVNATEAIIVYIKSEQMVGEPVPEETAAPELVTVEVEVGELAPA
jgi:predicted RNase H-like HicB family nuclease